MILAACAWHPVLSTEPCAQLLMTALAVQYEADWGTPQDPIGGLIRAGATWEGDWGPAPLLDPVGRILEGAHRPWQPVDSKYDVWQAVGRFARSPDPCSYPEWDPLAAALRAEAPQGEHSTGFGPVQAAGWLALAWHGARISRLLAECQLSSSASPSHWLVGQHIGGRYFQSSRAPTRLLTQDAGWCASCLAAGEAWADPLPSVLRGLRGLRVVGQGQACRARQADDGRAQERQLDAFAAAGDALRASGEGSSLKGGGLQRFQSEERRRRERESALALLAKYNPFEQVRRLHGLCTCPSCQVQQIHACRSRSSI